MEQHPTITDVARTLKRPASTLRSWRDNHRYSPYIASTDDGRRTRYLPEGVEAFGMIADMSDAGASPEQIEAALAATYSRTLEAQPQDTPAQQQGAAVLGEMMREAAAAGVREELGDMREAMERADREHALALERLREEYAKRDARVMAVLHERLPKPEAKRMGIMMRLMAMIEARKRHG